MNIKAALVLAAALHPLSNVAASEKWTEVSKDSIATMKLDTRSVSHVGEYVKAWILVDFARPNKMGLRSQKVLQLYSCTDRTVEFTQIVNYRKPNGAGPGDSVQSNTPYRQAVVPDTAGDLMLRSVCQVIAIQDYYQGDKNAIPPDVHKWPFTD
ncbi:hypothetical protein FHW67_003256 [Herbaspirillum sp. Sphag1AN]|uniref:surface-adhesin E family protein n=1 Tax=unclassified Herbaspirillum TaxID=2624150 RepID=UPI00161F48B6|nr:MULTISPECIES: surface-adhesin E family protein [unclassified Herbaspirillum]MBB3213950.1 hypothetical protein [Herbaspirillum sp. Sphag1AN]MBB3247147.1 hypothetical protein [Herbaspirillum sp. Sphag64]